MELEEFIKNYNIESIKQIEENKDRQFITLKNNWDKIVSIISTDKIELYKTNYLYMIIQTALISFQLSGKWEDWWTEISTAISNNPNILEDNNNLKRWESFINSCKNNKRLVAMKLWRLKKLDLYKEKFNSLEKMDHLYQNMNDLNKGLWIIMNQELTSKTIVFAVKMFWYGARFIFDKFIPYPFEIQIPVDSRIEKIYMERTWKEKYTKKEVMDFFYNLSKSFNIPPLHLDWLLWIEYWYNHTK